MVPVSLIHTRYRASSSTTALRPLYILLSLAAKYAFNFLRAEESIYGTGHYGPGGGSGGLVGSGGFVRRATGLQDAPRWKRIFFPILIPILVLLSGLFAGLTLGYMSLDETQLNVLSISGTPKQREYANKIKPIRKNGHLLLVTLLLSNMIVNETLPVIAEPVLGGGFPSVVISTVLIVIFSEIIPQSLFTRHGLYLGAKMAWFTRILIWGLGVISWPVAKLLEFVLGRHHGIIYRRAELKELIAMHDSHEAHGGDLKTDTVAIIGATLDLQEKVVRQAMTPIKDVFMLSIDDKLDYKLLKKIHQNGHSRVPVYEEVEVPIATVPVGSKIQPSSNMDSESSTSEVRNATKTDQRMTKVKKIVGVLLVKHCVLLDPQDATPLRKIQLNKVPFVPNNEPLLGMLDKFQEGRSHIAVVSRHSVEKAQSVKKAVKRGLTQRLRARVGMGDSDSSLSSSSDSEFDSGTSGISGGKRWSGRKKRNRRKTSNASKKNLDVEQGVGEVEADGATLKEYPTLESVLLTPPSVGTGGTAIGTSSSQETPSHRLKSGSTSSTGRDNKSNGADSEVAIVHNLGAGTGAQKKKTMFHLSALSKQAGAVMSSGVLEQHTPADAVLGKEGAAEFLQSIDPAVMPLGIITLEDVLEELIGEEIYDEFDPQGARADLYAYGTGTNPQAPLTPWTGAVGQAHTPDIKYTGEIVKSGPAISGTHGATDPTTLIISTATQPVAGDTLAPTTGTLKPALLPGFPIAKPLFRGFSFLTRRSKSAPPVPRDQPERRRSAIVGDESEGKHDEKENDGEKGEVVKNTESHDDAHVGFEATPAGHENTGSTPTTTHTGILGTPPQEIRMPKPIRGLPKATMHQLGMTSLVPPAVGPATGSGTHTPHGGSGDVRGLNPGSASPPPSLEAILLERNRRRLAREMNTSSPGNQSTGGGHGEGGGGTSRTKVFKSTPLSPPLSGSTGDGAPASDKAAQG